MAATLAAIGWSDSSVAAPYAACDIGIVASVTAVTPAIHLRATSKLFVFMRVFLEANRQRSIACAYVTVFVPAGPSIRIDTRYSGVGGTSGRSSPWVPAVDTFGGSMSHACSPVGVSGSPKKGPGAGKDPWHMRSITQRTEYIDGVDGSSYLRKVPGYAEGVVPCRSAGTPFAVSPGLDVRVVVLVEVVVVQVADGAGTLEQRGDRLLDCVVDRTQRRLLGREVAGDRRAGVRRPQQRDAGQREQHHRDQRDEEHDAALARGRVGGACAAASRSVHYWFQMALRNGIVAS